MNMRFFISMALFLSLESIGTPVINIAPLLPNLIPRLTDLPFLLEASQWRDMHIKTSDATVLLGQGAEGINLYYNATGFFIKTHPSRDYVCLLTAAHNFGGTSLLFEQGTIQDLTDVGGYYTIEFVYALRYLNDVFLNSPNPNFSSYGWKATKVKIKRLRLHPPVDYALLLVPKSEIPNIAIYTHGVDFLETVQVPPASTQISSFYMIHHGLGRPQLISTLYGQNGGVFYHTDHDSYRSARWFGNIETGASGAALVLPNMNQASEGAAIGIHRGRSIPNDGRIIEQFKLIRIQELIENECLITDDYKSPQKRRNGQYIQGASREGLEFMIAVTSTYTDHDSDSPHTDLCKAQGVNETNPSRCKFPLGSRINSTNVCGPYQNNSALSIRQPRAVGGDGRAAACVGQVQTDINNIKNEVQALINHIRSDDQLLSNTNAATLERVERELLSQAGPALQNASYSNIDISELSEYEQRLTQLINYISYIKIAPPVPTNPPNTWLPYKDNWKSWFLYRTGPGFIYYNIKGKKTTPLLPDTQQANRNLKELYQRLINNQAVIREILRQVSHHNRSL